MCHGIRSNKITINSRSSIGQTPVRVKSNALTLFLHEVQEKEFLIMLLYRIIIYPVYNMN